MDSAGVSPENSDMELVKELNVTVGPPLSQLLGLLVVLASTVTKIPQIYKLHKCQNGRGLSIYGVTLDLLSSTVYMFYNSVKGYPFRTYGEALFQALQTLTIASQILTYDKSPVYATVYVGGYGALCLVFANGIVSIKVISLLQSVNILTSLSAKGTQIYKNYCNQHTGQLSAVTPFLTLGASVIRIFTSIKETNDPMIVSSCIASAIANSIVCTQVFYYWENEDLMYTQE